MPTIFSGVFRLGIYWKTAWSRSFWHNEKWYALFPKVEAETFLNGSSFHRDNTHGEQKKKSDNRWMTEAEVSGQTEVRSDETVGEMKKDFDENSD